MAQKRYRLRYLPLLYEDLLEASNHIFSKLKNEKAAEDLLNQTENAINERLLSPESFEKYYNMMGS